MYRQGKEKGLRTEAFLIVSFAMNLNVHCPLFPRALLGSNKQHPIQRLNLLVMTLLNKHENYFLFHAPTPLSVFSYCFSSNTNRCLVMTWL
jgi:hypothetical protein